MKRAEITRRDINGNALSRQKGWAAEIDGIPVVLCRSDARRPWEVCEPKTGLPVLGSTSRRREDALASVTARVESISAGKGKRPRDVLGELIDQYLAKHAAARAA